MYYASWWSGRARQSIAEPHYSVYFYDGQSIGFTWKFNKLDKSVEVMYALD